MKSWQLNRRVGNLSEQIDDPAKSETRIDINCLTEPERVLFEKVHEIMDKYSPAIPPQDVFEKNADLWYKGLEIFGRRATELFVEVVPDSFCCDELEKWYFKIYFHNFMLDWLEQVEQVRKMPKEKRDALIVEHREMGISDRVFRLKRYTPPTLQKQNGSEEQES